jgi:5-formyltetrahydrofolate cyclo-ligase
LNPTVQGHIGSGILGDLSVTPNATPPRHRSPVRERATSRERQTLRRHFRRLRKALSASAQSSHAAAIIRLYFTRGLALRAGTTGLYVATDGEVDLGPLLERLPTMRKRVALPVVRRQGIMTFHRYRDHASLVPNRFGILEPGPDAPVIATLAIDLLLVPLVAFDDSGTRLGMGVGYYDRCLGRVPAPLRPHLVGVAHEVQRSRDALPRDDWDVPLHGVLTEAGWQTFQK